MYMVEVEGRMRGSCAFERGLGPRMGHHPSLWWAPGGWLGQRRASPSFFHSQQQEWFHMLTGSHGLLETEAVT